MREDAARWPRCAPQDRREGPVLPGRLSSRRPRRHTLVRQRRTVGRVIADLMHRPSVEETPIHHHQVDVLAIVDVVELHLLRVRPGVVDGPTLFLLRVPYCLSFASRSANQLSTQTSRGPSRAPLNWRGARKMNVLSVGVTAKDVW